MQVRPNGQKRTPADGRMEVPYILQPNGKEERFYCMPDTIRGSIIASFVDCSQCHTLMHRAMTGPVEAAVLALQEMSAHVDERKCPKFRRKNTSHVGNGKPVGPFAFTLTKSPKDSLTVGDMLIAVRKILGQRTKPVLRYAWYYEDKGRHENGDPIHPHIHGMYETEDGGRIPARQFERAWKIWDETKPLGAGFVGGYHRVVKHDEAYSDYIKKDGGMGETKGL